MSLNDYRRYFTMYHLEQIIFLKSLRADIFRAVWL